MKRPQNNVAILTALAICISEGKSSKELIYIAAIFTQLSNTLSAIAITTADLDLEECVDGPEDDND